MEKLSDLFGFLCHYKPYKKTLGYFGWTGMGNLGDEALFDAVKNLLLPVNVLKHLRYYGRGKIIKNFLEDHLFTGMLLGAGTLINSSAYLKSMQKLRDKGLRTFIFGTGVMDPQFHSKYPNWPNCLPEWVNLLYSCEYVSVRGPLSQKILEEYGYKNAVVCGDPAVFFARDEIKSRLDRKLIGLNIGTTLNGVSLWGESDEKVLSFAIKLSQILYSKGYKVVLFPVWINDIEICTEVAKKVGHDIEIIDCHYDIESYLKLVGNVDIFIGEKLHSVILSLCTYTPSIMLSYTPKGEDFMSLIDNMEFSLRTNALDIEKVLFLIDKIENGYIDHQKHIYQQLIGIKRKLFETATDIKNLL